MNGRDSSLLRPTGFITFLTVIPANAGIQVRLRRNVGGLDSRVRGNDMQCLLTDVWDDSQSPLTVFARCFVL